MALVSDVTSRPPDTEIDLQLQPDEMQKLGLKQQPFSPVIDSNKLFHDPQIEMTSNICIEYLQHPNLSILLLGEAGSGKTSLLRQILLRSFQDASYCVLRASENQSYSAICQKLLARWGNPETSTTSEAALIEAIDNRENHSVAVLIDDADKLSVDTLVALMRLKSRLQHEHQVSFGLLLAGQSFLRNTLTECEKIDADASSTYQINLRPLSQEQSELYIQQRLAELVEPGSELLSTKDIAAIAKASAGNFSQIQAWVLCALRAQLAGETFKPQAVSGNQKSQSPLYKRWLCYGFIAVVPVLALLAIIFSHFTSTSPIENEVYDLSLPGIDPTISLKATPSTISTTLDSVSSTTEPSTEVVENPTLDDIKTAPVLNGIDWLRTLATEHYTLQLVATRKLENLNLIKRHKLALPNAYFEKPINGVTFYILVMGDFKSTAQARQAIASLPQELQAFEPWPVTIASLQKYIQ